MGLKQLIKQQKILATATAEAVETELVLPGEPLIYSIKFRMGQRKNDVQFFRDMKWKSLIKCWFRSQYKTKSPVVILVRFFVSPPSSLNMKAAELKRESTPAVFSYEVCDYLLSFLEMLHHVLINSYRQVVKVDAEKFYSADPRTVFKFMTWSEYVKLQSGDPIHTEAQRVSAHVQGNSVQPQRQGNDA